MCSEIYVFNFFKESLIFFFVYFCSVKKVVINRKTYRFRRFENKSYSAFASMHKCVTIGKLSVDICNSSLKKSEKDQAFLLLNVDSLSNDDDILTDDSVALETSLLLDLEDVLVANIASEKAASSSFANYFIQKYGFDSVWSRTFFYVKIYN